MKKILSLLLLSAAPVISLAWGPNGHDAIAYIAERNITEKTAETLSYYLEGRSIVYYANWMDEMRRLAPYKGTLEGHSFAVDANLELRLLEDPTNTLAGGHDDGLFQYLKMVQSIAGGRYKPLSKEEVALAIKKIVHLVGDYHCPAHVRYMGVPSKNIVYNGKKVKYHTFWDSTLITSCHRWNYMEYGYALGRLSEQEEAEITAGDICDWCEETARECRCIHDWVSDGDEFTKQMVYDLALPLADSQLQKAGYRLAKVLNELFGN